MASCMGGGASGKDDTSSSSSEDDEEYNEKVRVFCAEVVVAVGKVAPRTLKRAIGGLHIKDKVLKQRAGDTIRFTFKLGYGKEVTLLDGDGKRFHISCNGNETVEENLYTYFLQRSFPGAAHAEHCNMGDCGRFMHVLVQNMCITMDVVVRKGKDI